MIKLINLEQYIQHTYSDTNENALKGIVNSISNYKTYDIKDLIKENEHAIYYQLERTAEIDSIRIVKGKDK